MTIEEFRAHETLPDLWAKEIRENVLLRTVLFDVMENHHPSHFVLLGDNDNDISPTRAAIELGVSRGYSKYGDTLRLLSRRKATRKDPGEPTYSKEQKPDQSTPK